MDIKKFKNKKSLFIYTERYVNKDAYHSFRHYSEVSKQFRPRDGKKSFKLPFVEIVNSKIDFLKTTPDNILLNFVQNKEKTKFFFHPDMDNFYKKSGCQYLTLKKANSFIDVTPTSSTRTLLFNLNAKNGNEKLFMVKVDLSGKRLGRLVRDLRGNSARQSNRVSSELNYLAEKNLLPKSMAYLPETIATIFTDSGIEVANIFREYVPKPLSKDHKFMVPLFSLYSPDDNDLLAPFLIEQLIKISGLIPKEFFEKKIVKPILWNFFYMTFKFGLLFEAHPQNTLLELDKNFNPQRIIYRDLQAVMVDKELRFKRGYSSDGFQENKIAGNRKPQTSKKIEYSTIYDHRIAYQTLEEFIIALANKYIVSIDELRKVVQNNARKILKKLEVNPNDYFPKDSYYLFEDGMNKDSQLTIKKHLHPPYR